MLNVISDTCPQDFRATRGRIQSPGFPGYRNNVYCQINLHYEEGHLHEWRVFVDVEEFDVDNGHDFLLTADYAIWWLPTYKPVYMSSGHNFTGEVIWCCRITYMYYCCQADMFDCNPILLLTF